MLNRRSKRWIWIVLGAGSVKACDVLGPHVGQVLRYWFPDKKPWDYIELIVPIASSIILGLVVLQLQERNSEERELARKENQAVESIQRFFDRIEKLLVDHKVLYLADSEKRLEEGYRDAIAESARKVVRARTLSMLRAFSNDSERKTAIVRFLIDSEIVPRLGVSLNGADLSNADLCCVSLVGADLNGADLSGAKLRGSDLANIDKGEFVDGEWRPVSIKPTSLMSANLKGADLSDARLNGAQLQSADLTSAILTDAALKYCNLSAAKLIGANLQSASLIGADLSCADFSGADLSYARLCETDLEYVTWDAKTVWPDSGSFLGVRNAPVQLRTQLGLP
jgi:uncharacterized protein YjbI with pentapeptide repeats